MADDIELGTRFLPSLLVEDSEGMIQVYAKQGENIVPKKISGLTATSLDSSIVRVIDVRESKTGFDSEIRIKAMKAGDTSIFIVGPGFSALEIPVTIHGNKLTQEQLLIKVIPDSFSANGPWRGYVSVQLADDDGFPVVATKDTVINLSSGDNKILNLLQNDIIINKGEYFAYAQFEVKDDGETKIYASSLGMNTEKSETILIEEESDLEIEFFLIPDEINTFANSRGYVIAQLQSGDEPIIAKNDITIHYSITNSQFGTVNSSPSIDEYANIKHSGFFEIKKGSYWAYLEYSTLSGIEDIYTIQLSTQDPLQVETLDVVTSDLEFFDDKLVKFEALPILATGNRELIGVVYLEDDNDNPILAERDIFIDIDSSDEDFLKVEKARIIRGFSSALVFAQVGHNAPDELELHAVVDDGDEVIDADISGATRDTNTLVVEPLVSEVLAGKEFPIAVYLENGNQLSTFGQTGKVFITPSDFFEIESKNVVRGDDIVLFNSKSLVEGTDIITFITKYYETDLFIESVSAKPSLLRLDYSETIFTGTNDVFAVQLLDSSDSPVFANEDVEIKFVLKDESLMEIPESITIEKGEYFALFDVAPKISGMTELSLVANELPLETYDIEITSLEPEISILAPTIIEEGESFMATISVSHENNPLQNMAISWNVQGGLVQLSDTKTGTTGEGIISIIPIDKGNVKINVDVSGSWYSPTKTSAVVRINSTNSEFLAYADEGVEVQYGQIEVFGIDPVLILVPAVLVTMGYIFKKKGMLKVKVEA